MQLELDSLFQNAQSGRVCTNDVKRITALVQTGLHAIEELLVPVMMSIPISERSTCRSAKLAKYVFETTELLEWILKFCRPLDVLRFSQAHDNKWITSTIEDPRWQRYMGLQPDYTAFHLPFEDAIEETGLHFGQGSRCTGHNDGTWHAQVVIKLDNKHINICRKLNDLGEKERTMLISQPPLRQVEFHTYCDFPNRRDDFTGPERTITSQNGVTIGEVLLNLADFQEGHLLCPDATSLDGHDEHEYVHHTTEGVGSVEVPQNDPALWRMVEEDDYIATTDSKHERIYSYIGAKVQGKQVFSQGSGRY